MKTKELFQKEQSNKNKEILKRLIDEAFNNRNLDILEEVLHPEFTNHQEVFPLKAKKGPEVFRELYSAFFHIFSDVKADYTHIISEGDYVMARDFITGTNDGEINGNPATGKKVKFEVFHLYRIKDGKLIERWGLTDDLSLMKQLES
ncbi:ester cyclase [Winogradskyella sp.]|uniref:ester cyclase n=1 Tax=Winogradskyella sp. TaxID=1883156 RepID=UPI002611D64F|nr:ester cyclase [Winogradskyella sp.]